MSNIQCATTLRSVQLKMHVNFEFALFCRNFKNVAKCAFLCYFLELKYPPALLSLFDGSKCIVEIVEIVVHGALKEHHPTRPATCHITAQFLVRKSVVVIMLTLQMAIDQIY